METVCLMVLIVVDIIIIMIILILLLETQHCARNVCAKVCTLYMQVFSKTFWKCSLKPSNFYFSLTNRISYAKLQGSRQENIYSDFQKSSFLSYTHVRYLKRKLSTTVLQKSSKMFGFYIHKLGKQARMGFLASNGDAGNWTFLKSFRGFFGRFFGKYLGKFWGKFLGILWAIWI